jgi:hypothetical protein
MEAPTWFFGFLVLNQIATVGKGARFNEACRRTGKTQIYEHGTDLVLLFFFTI